MDSHCADAHCGMPHQTIHACAKDVGCECVQNLDLVVYERYVPMKTTKAMHCQLQAIPCDRYQSLRSGELFEVSEVMRLFCIPLRLQHHLQF